MTGRIKRVYRICNRWIVIYESGVLREFVGVLGDMPKRVQFFIDYLADKEVYKGVVIYDKR